MVYKRINEKWFEEEKGMQQMMHAHIYTIL